MLSSTSVFNSLRTVVLALLLAVAGAAVAAQALDLDDAKAQGLVGETLEGYLAAVNDRPAPAVAALVGDINAKRRVEYQRIARDNGIDLAQVEALAAKKAIEKTRPGGWVRVDGSWRQK
ncbi:MAG: YdbL family protein [Pseudomonadales bacterium]